MGAVHDSDRRPGRDRYQRQRAAGRQRDALADEALHDGLPGVGRTLDEAKPEAGRASADSPAAGTPRAGQPGVHASVRVGPRRAGCRRRRRQRAHLDHGLGPLLVGREPVLAGAPRRGLRPATARKWPRVRVRPTQRAARAGPGDRGSATAVGRGVGGVDARETVPVDRYDADELGRWVVEVLRASGIPLAHAESTARALVRTSIRGVDTHGVARLPSYVERI